MRLRSFVKAITNANLLCLFSFVSAVSAFLFYSCRANYIFIDTAVFRGLAALLLALMLFVAVVLLVLYELRVHEVRRKDALLYEKKGFAGDAAVSDRFAEKRCVVVDLCRVKRPVPRFDRGRENAVRLFRVREMPGAETQSRQPRPVLERNAAVGMIEHDEVPFVFLLAQC